MGSIFTALDVTRGAPFNVGLWGRNVGFIFAYGGLICPMESISGRKSAVHNAISGATIGYFGVMRGFLGIPGVDPYFFYRYPRISPPLMGAGIYGSVGGLIAAAFGKPI